MVIGVRAGTVVYAPASPGCKTFKSLNSGSHFAIGSESWKRPSSKSINAADRNDRLGHRGLPKDRIGCHRRLRLGVAVADAFEVRHPPVTRDERDDASHVATVHVPLHGSLETGQALRRQSDVLRASEWESADQAPAPSAGPRGRGAPEQDSQDEQATLHETSTVTRGLGLNSIRTRLTVDPANAPLQPRRARFLQAYGACFHRWRDDSTGRATRSARPCG